MKQHFKIKKKSTNRTINQVFSELIDKLGGKYSARFLYQSAERIVNLHLKSTKFNEGYGRPNFHSCGYFSKDVSRMIENQPWLPVYNEHIHDIDCSYNHNQFLKELGVR